MTWTTFRDCSGQQWQVERDALCGLIRANIRSVTIRKRARVKVEKAWFAPELHTVEVEWKGLDEEVNVETQRWWADTEQRLKFLPAQRVFTDIALLREETLAKTSEFQHMQREASKVTARNIAGDEAFWDKMIKGAEVTRDVSAGVIMVGCTILSGGAAGGALMAATGAGTAAGATASAGAVTTFLAVGSTLKGVAKYQDLGKEGVKFEGRIGSALVEGVGNFGIGMIGLGAGSAGASAGSQKVLMVVTSGLDAGFEGSKALIEGASGKEALAKAGAKFGVGVAGGILGGAIPVEKMALIANVGINTGLNMASDKAAGGLADAMAGKPGQDAGGKLGAVPNATGTLSFAPAVKGAPATNAHDEYVRRTVLRRAA